MNLVYYIKYLGILWGFIFTLILFPNQVESHLNFVELTKAAPKIRHVFIFNCYGRVYCIIYERVSVGETETETVRERVKVFSVGYSILFDFDLRVLRNFKYSIKM